MTLAYAAAQHPRQIGVEIPLFKDAKMILEKYEYNIKFLSLTNINKYIKEACKIAGINKPVEIEERIGGKKTYTKIPKYEKISTHVAIKTYVTACDRAGMPIKLISEITGKSVGVITKHYLGIDNSVLKKYADMDLYQ